MRHSGVFSLTGFNPFLFLCLLLIISSRYADFDFDIYFVSWIPVRCISISDTLFIGLLCFYVRALHRVFVGYDFITIFWVNHIYLKYYYYI